MALSAGAQYIELDVHLTLDHQLVVHHDPQVKTPNGTRTIAQCTAAQLALEAPLIPVLSDVLDLCANKSVVYTEIKTTTPAAVGLVHTAAHHTNCAIILSSFHHAHLPISKELAALVPTMALLEWNQSLPLDLIQRNLVNEIGVGDNARVQDRANAAHRAGLLPTYVYTVNDPQRMRQLEEWGIAGVFTDTL